MNISLLIYVTKIHMEFLKCFKYINIQIMSSIPLFLLNVSVSYPQARYIWIIRHDLFNAE